jgi:glycosyltransferase involved in cell wall biosynthesis
MSNKNDPTKAGGLDVLFDDLLHQFDKNKIPYSVIDADKSNYTNNLIALLSIWYNLLIQIRKFDHISLHGSVTSYIFVAPFAVFLAMLFNKTVSLRKFAGDFDKLYEEMPFFIRWIVTWALKHSNANFFETHYLVKYFSHLNKNTYWFPNVRTKPNTIRSGDFKKRFLFVGNITKEKGILELLEASNKLDNTYTIHLYGKINPDLSEFDFSTYKAVYKNPLTHEKVLETMHQYDVLVLPSYREGYPGVVIEALSMGLPVIVTNLSGIKEMVNENCAIFVRPRNYDDIVNSISFFNNKNYPGFSANALKSFELFDSDLQTIEFINRIHIKGKE